MKKISKLLSVLLALAMVMSFALVASAEENTTAGFVASELGYENDTAVENIEGDVISFTFSDGGNSHGNCPKYYTNGTAIRFYAQNTLTISVAEGYVIESVEITTDSSKPMTADNTALTNATGAYTSTATTLTPADGTQDVVMQYTPSSGHWRVQAITVTYATSAGGEEEVVLPAGPVACEIPGTLSYTFETDDAASAGVIFQWTATEAGELGVARMGDGYMTSVNVNGQPAVIGTNGYTVAAGDVVEITVIAYGAGAVSVPVSYTVSGGEEDADLGTAANPETVTVGDYEKTLESGDYYYQFTAPVAGELTITTTGDGSHNLNAYVNGDQTKQYSNWDNNGEFVKINVAQGDVVTFFVYFDFGSGTINFNVALPGAEQTPVEPPVEETPAVPTIADGKYVISYGELTFAALAEEKTYGYAPAGDLNNLTDADYITITNVDGGFTMQDCYGRYIYMTGTYNSFNVSAEAPAEGHIWTLVEVEGGYYIQNVLKEKHISYSAGYGTFGSYAEPGDNSVLTITAVVEEETPVEPTYITVHVTAEHWTNIYGYVWAPEALGTWPGTLAENGSFVVAAGFEGMVLSNGEGTQTPDIKDIDQTKTEVWITVNADNTYTLSYEAPVVNPEGPSTGDSILPGVLVLLLSVTGLVMLTNKKEN